MKFSQNDKSHIFSNTEIPDIFFTDYLPEASGDFIKVYFHVLFLSKYNKEVKLNDIAKSISLEYPTVKEAFDYWEDKGLFIKTTEGYNILSIQEIELNKLYSPKVTSTPKEAIKNSQSKYRATAIENINTQFFQGMMSPSWYNDIDLWFNKYGFDEQVMLALFSYAYDKKALHRNYITATAEAWSANKIRNFNDLELYFTKKDERNNLTNQISKKLNLYRKLSTYEEEEVIKWTENYNYNMDIIEIALKNASTKNKINFGYIDSLLTDWHKKELTTVDEVNAYLNSIKDSDNKQTKSNKSKASNTSYSQIDFTSLESLYDN